MKERRNYYRTLGVQPDVSREVIRSAWRTLMQKLKMHPDLGGDTAIAAQINTAYRVLSNPRQRAEYDLRLLQRWDLAELAGSRGGAVSAGGARLGCGNRRNYYRVLGVQPDADAALIESAYRVLSNEPDVERRLLNEASKVLLDQKRRAQYDQWLAESDHVDISNSSSTDYALIARFCFFCKAPHCEYPLSDSTQFCLQCGCPINLAINDDGANRRFQRQDFSHSVIVYQSTGGSPHKALLSELTPQGLKLVQTRALPPGSIVRVQATDLDCVAQVVHASVHSHGFEMGMKLLCVAFNVKGLFIQAYS